MNKDKNYYIYEMDIKALNIFSIVLFILVLLLTILVNKTFFFESVDYVFSGMNFVTFFILYFFYMLLHELLHSASYVLNGANFKNVIYGAMLEKGVLYCLCKENITKRNILVSLLTPLFIIGILTLIVSIIFKLPYLLFLSIFNISGCAGDIIMFAFISKLKRVEFTEFDNPIAFAIYTREDVTKIKSLGLNFIEKCDEVKREYLKKITVSKPSMIFFIGCIIILIVSLFI